MSSKIVVVSAVMAACLAACGGGGGGGGGSGTTASTSTTPVVAAQVQITSANATSVAANALDAAQNTDSAGTTTSLVSAVQVQPSGALSQPEMLTRVARWASGVGAPQMATGVLTPQTATCSNGGSITVSGNVAVQGSLNAGDGLTLQANNCAQMVDGTLITIDGTMAVAVTAGSLLNGATPPFHIAIRFTTTNLSLTAGSERLTSNGDMTVDWTESSLTSDTLTISGSSLASGATTPNGFRTVTWTNYSQAITVVNTTVTSALNGTVTSDNPHLGTGGGVFTVTTSTPLQWAASSGVPTAGVFKVVGAGNSAVRVTFSSTGATIQVDANGDGTYESSSTATVAQLRAAL